MTLLVESGRGGINSSPPWLAPTMHGATSFEVVSRAYGRQSIIMTTNLPFEQWTEILVNERLTGALLDRITHRVHIIEANGESFRLKDAKKRTKRK
jgi:DNA replication protein DnaC